MKKRPVPRDRPVDREFPPHPRRLKLRTWKKRTARFVRRVLRRYARELDRHDAVSFPANRAIALRGPLRATDERSPVVAFHAWPNWAEDRPPWWFVLRPEPWELARRRRDDRWTARQPARSVDPDT